MLRHMKFFFKILETNAQSRRGKNILKKEIFPTGNLCIFAVGKKKSLKA